MLPESAMNNSCLIISHNGDSEQLEAMLMELGLNPVASGTGREGAMAIKHYRPKAVILIYHAGSSQDVIALRAIQDRCRQKQSPVAVIVSAKEMVPIVRRLLVLNHCSRRVNLLACPSCDRPGLTVKQTLETLGGELKPVLHKLLQQRPPAVVQATPA